MKEEIRISPCDLWNGIIKKGSHFQRVSGGWYELLNNPHYRLPAELVHSWEIVPEKIKEPPCITCIERNPVEIEKVILGFKNKYDADLYEEYIHFTDAVRRYIMEMNRSYNRGKDWKPDWNDSNYKYILILKRGMDIGYVHTKDILALPIWKYMKTHSVAKMVIERFDNNKLINWWIKG